MSSGSNQHCIRRDFYNYLFLFSIFEGVYRNLPAILERNCQLFLYFLWPGCLWNYPWEESRGIKVCCSNRRDSRRGRGSRWPGHISPENGAGLPPCEQAHLIVGQSIVVFFLMICYEENLIMLWFFLGLFSFCS